MNNNSDLTKTASAGGRRPRRGRSRRFTPVVREDMGKWIWIDEPAESRNSYLYARKLFEISGKPSEAILKASSDTRYKLFINGEYVGKGPVRSCSGFAYLDTHDITRFLKKGKNVIAFLAHHIGDPTNFAALKRPGLICKADITVGEETQTVMSDETWKVHKAEDWTSAGERIGESLGYQEVYDSGLRMDAWTEIKFREKGWQDATVVGLPPLMPWGKLVDRQIPQLAEEPVYPQAIISLANSPERSIDTPAGDIAGIMAESELTELKSGSVKGGEALLAESGVTKVSTPRSDAGVVLILDFGREVFGNVELGISGSGSGVIDIGYSETLQDNRVKPNPSGLKYTDRVILKKGKLDWQGFEPRAFRYMQLEFRRCSKAAALDYIRVNQTHYPVEHTGSFECSDNLLNDIWRTAAYTTELCMEDTFIDSPWRERAQWWGDARIQARSAYYAFNDSTLLAQGLRQIAAQQAHDGSLLGMYPGSSDKLVPDYALDWVFSLLDYYAYSDDADLLRELYPSMERLLGWFSRYLDSDGLLAEVPGWLFVDWAEIEKKGQVTALNCLYYHALRVAAIISSIIERDEAAEAYLEASARLRLVINKYLYAPKRGLYADNRVDGVLSEQFTSQTNILAALFDIPDHYRKASILRAVIGSSLPEITTPYFASHLVEVLCAGDRHVDALHVLRKRWGEMLKAGATTFWEFFTGEGSKCHGWSGGPVRDLIAEFVGIKPVIGSHRFSVTPRMGDLKWARGTVMTNFGPLTVEWKIIRGALVITAEVPEGLKVDVYPPVQPDYKTTVNGAPHASSLVTLSGGSHVVRVAAARPPRRKPLDKSLEPAPMLHVEILDTPLGRGRRRLGLGLTSGRRRRGSKNEEPLVETGVVEAEETEVELVTGAEPEVAEEETGRKSRRKRTRRGGRGKARAAEGVEQVEAAPAEETAESAAAQPEVTEETAGEAPKSRRRRSRRGRGKSAVQEAVPTEQAEAPAPEAEAPAAEETLEEAAPAAEEPRTSRRRRSRRGGRGRGKAAQEAVEAGVAEPAAETAAEPVVEAVAAVETVEAAGEEPAAEPRSRRRRSRRGGRGRSNRTAEPQEQPEAATEPAAVEVAVAAEPEPVSAPEPEAETSARPQRRRSRGGRRHRKEHAEQPVEVQPEAQPAREQQPAEPPVVAEVPVVAEPAAAEAKPSRARRPRRTRKTEPTPADQASVAVEPAPALVEAKPELPEPAVNAEEPAKPKRSRRTARKTAKPAESAPEAAVPELPAEPAPEPVAEGAEPPKKKRTYTRKPRKKPEAEGEAQS